jgi:hypothetical protein
MFDHLHCLVDRSIGMTTQGFIPRSRARAAGCSSSAGARAAI